MKGRKEVGEGGESRKEKNIYIENSKRNDLRDRRNRVAKHYDLNDMKTSHHADIIKKNMMGTKSI